MNININIMSKKFLKVYSDHVSTLTKGKLYEVFAEFETDECSSGMCIIVLDDNDNFSGFDSKHFE